MGIWGQTGFFDWAGGEKYLETAIDLDDGGGYTVLGVMQFLSVPYSFVSERSFALTLSNQNGNQYDEIIDTLGNLAITPIQWQCGTPMIDPRDGQFYATVQIGS